MCFNYIHTSGECCGAQSREETQACSGIQRKHFIVSALTEAYRSAHKLFYGMFTGDDGRCDSDTNSAHVYTYSELKAARDTSWTHKRCNIALGALQAMLNVFLGECSDDEACQFVDDLLYSTKFFSRNTLKRIFSKVIIPCGLISVCC